PPDLANDRRDRFECFDDERIDSKHLSLLALALAKAKPPQRGAQGRSRIAKQPPKAARPQASSLNGPSTALASICERASLPDSDSDSETETETETATATATARLRGATAFLSARSACGRGLERLSPSAAGRRGGRAPWCRPAGRAPGTPGRGTPRAPSRAPRRRP